MTVRYTNTFRDQLAFAGYHQTHSRASLCVLGFVVLAASSSVYQSLPPNNGILVTTIVFVLMDVLVLAFLFAVMALITGLSIVSRRNKTFRTEHVITLAETALLEQTTYNRTEHTWDAVQALGRTRHYLFIYVSEGAAHVVPKRAFSSNREWDEFYETCRQRSGMRGVT